MQVFAFDNPETRIYYEILANHSTPAVRPVAQPGDALEVEVGFSLTNILNFDIDNYILTIHGLKSLVSAVVKSESEWYRKQCVGVFINSFISEFLYGNIRYMCMFYYFPWSGRHSRETMTHLHTPIGNIMMTSSNENIFRVTGPFCGNSPVTGEFPTHKGQWRGTLMLSLICDWINGWVNNREVGDLRRHRAHYDVIVMHCCFWPLEVRSPIISSNGINSLKPSDAYMRQ